MHNPGFTVSSCEQLNNNIKLIKSNAEVSRYRSTQRAEKDASARDEKGKSSSSVHPVFPNKLAARNQATNERYSLMQRQLKGRSPLAPILRLREHNFSSINESLEAQQQNQSQAPLQTKTLFHPPNRQVLISKAEQVRPKNHSQNLHDIREAATNNESLGVLNSDLLLNSPQQTPNKIRSIIKNKRKRLLLTQHLVSIEEQT